MSSGHSDLALPFLLWASVCMEQSVPLLLPKYLTWRTTLYVAVCESYFASGMGKAAEEFARRALNKINELNELEAKSSSALDAKSISAFRHATVKVCWDLLTRAFACCLLLTRPLLPCCRV